MQIRGLSSSLLATFGSAATGGIAGLVLARSLGPELRGEFAAAVLWPNVLVLFGDLGLGFAVAFYSGKSPQSRDDMWSLSILTAAIWGGILTLGGMLILPGMLPFSPEVIENLRILLFTIPFMLLTGYLTFLLLGSGALWESNLLRWVSSAGYVGAIVSCAFTGRADPFSYSVAYLIAQCGVSIFGLVLVVRRLSPRFTWRPVEAGGAFRYAVRMYLSSIAAQMNLRLDQLILSLLVPATALGLYSVAVATSVGVMPVFTAFAIVSLADVTKARSADIGAAAALSWVRLSFVLAIPLAMLGIVFVPWLLPLLFGLAFSGSIGPAQILVVAAVVQGLNSVLNNCLCGLGLPGRTAWAQACGLVLTLVLLTALIPRFGITGAAVASLLAYTSVLTLQSLFLTRATAVSLIALVSPRALYAVEGVSVWRKIRGQLLSR